LYWLGSVGKLPQHLPMLFLQEFESLIQKPYTIVYFHSAASLQVSVEMEITHCRLVLTLVYETKIFN
jgi:hypothetical protein